MSIKRKFKSAIRYILKCRKNEKITDAIDRYKTKVECKFYKKEVNQDTLLKELVNLGLSKGDVVMVHSSWRKFYNYDASPIELIEGIIDIIGEEGTLLMPCYGDRRDEFDVINTPSHAGVLSEVFRNYKSVTRSKCSHFSVCAYGKLANDLTRDHIKSEFGFDYHSPYYKFCNLDNSKILLLGMGKYPIKLTAIHCVEYLFKDTYRYFNEYLSYKYEAKVIDENGILHRKNMIAGVESRLYKKNIKKIYKRLSKEDSKYSKIGNIDCRLLNAKVTFKEIIKATHNGEVMINPPRLHSKSFELINKKNVI